MRWGVQVMAIIPIFVLFAQDLYETYSQVATPSPQLIATPVPAAPVAPPVLLRPAPRQSCCSLLPRPWPPLLPPPPFDSLMAPTLVVHLSCSTMTASASWARRSRGRAATTTAVVTVQRGAPRRFARSLCCVGERTR